MRLRSHSRRSRLWLRISSSNVEPGSRAYKWLVVGMLWLVCLFNYADRQAIFSVFPAVKADLRLSDWQLGLAGASFMWVYALCGPVAGWLGDRLSRKKLIIGALIFWSVVTGATAWAHGFGALVTLRGLGGLGEAFYFPAAMSMLSDYHDSGTRSRAMSLHQSSVYAGTVAGATVTGYVADAHGWRVSFEAFGLAGILLGVVLLLWLREPSRQAAGKRTKSGPLGFRGSLTEISSNARARVLIAVFMGANFVAVVFLTWMPTYLYKAFHLSLGAAGFHSSAYLQIASVLGVLLGGWMADRWARTERRGRMRTQAVGLLCGVPFLVLMGSTLSLAVLVMAMTGFGFCKGIYDSNIFASLHDVTAPDRWAAATGVMNSLGWLAGGVAPLAIAWAAGQMGFAACLTGTAVVYLLAGGTLAWVSMRRKIAPC